LTLVANGSSRSNDWSRPATFWDISTGQLLGEVRGHLGGVTTLAFSPDGRQLITGGTDGNVLVWDVGALPTARPPAPRQPTRQELEDLWVRLAGSDVQRAYETILVFSAGGKESVAFLQGRLAPARGLSEAALQQAIADLNDGRYAVRAKASALLATQDVYAAKALCRALHDPGVSLEMRRRIELLLPKLQRPAAPSPGELRALRALAILERIGDAEARKLLEVLAAGSPAARLTQQARAALVHLAQLKS
jgi:hypothetical protein